jgi:hypothetical protein
VTPPEGRTFYRISCRKCGNHWDSRSSLAIGIPLVPRVRAVEHEVREQFRVFPGRKDDLVTLHPEGPNAFRIHFELDPFKMSDEGLIEAFVDTTTGEVKAYRPGPVAGTLKAELEAESLPVDVSDTIELAADLYKDGGPDELVAPVGLPASIRQEMTVPVRLVSLITGRGAKIVCSTRGEPLAPIDGVVGDTVFQTYRALEVVGTADGNVAIRRVRGGVADDGRLVPVAEATVYPSGDVRGVKPWLRDVARAAIGAAKSGTLPTTW